MERRRCNISYETIIFNYYFTLHYYVAVDKQTLAKSDFILSISTAMF